MLILKLAFLFLVAKKKGNSNVTIHYLSIVKKCNNLPTSEKNSPLKNPQELLPKHHTDSRWSASSLQLPVWPDSSTDDNDTLFFLWMCAGAT